MSRMASTGWSVVTKSTPRSRILFQVFFFVRRPGIYFQTAAMRFFYPFGMLVEHLEIIVYASETFGFGFLGRRSPLM